MPIYQGNMQSETNQSLIERAASRINPAIAYGPRVEASEPENDGIDLRELWRVIVNRRGTIIFFTLSLLLLVWAVVYLMTPTYRASLTLQIDREDLRVVKIEEVTPAETTGTSLDYYPTQYELLKSRNLAQRVIDQLNLGDRLPEQSVLSSIKRWLATQFKGLNNYIIGKKAEPPPQAAHAAVVMQAFSNALVVDPVRNSRLVKLYYNSVEPELAASVLNTLAKAFVDLNLERRFEASQYARNFLQERLQQIKAKLEDSEREMVEFATKQGIVNVSGDENKDIVAQRLADLNIGLAAVEKQRIGAEAVYRKMLDTRGHGLSQVLDSKIIQDLKDSKAKLEAQYQENLKIYKPAYPIMVQLRGQIDQTNRQIEQEVANIRGAITTTYEAAKTEESLLRTKLDQIKGDVLNLQGHNIQLSILRREADTNRELYNGLLQRYKEIGAAAGIGTNNISVVDEATPPIFPYKPNLPLYTLLALVIGLMGGIGLAFLREHFDDTFKQPEEIEKLLGLSVLGFIPWIQRKRGETRPVALMSNDKPGSPLAEAYRSLGATLVFSTSSGMPRSLAVTSATIGEGKSTSVVNLGIQFARAGKKVLLIDADLRNPVLHRLFEINNDVGLTNLLTGDQARSANIAKSTQVPDLFVITSGPMAPNPAELLAGSKMVDLLALASEKFDQILVDSPPVMGLADALILGNLCDGTLLSIDMNHTRRDYIRAACKRLRGARVHLIGVLLTKIQAHYGTYSYYHDSNYYSGVASSVKNLAS
ncbi:MAG: polysaccharide biosynthesis tyrosine autokinase [Candidatus Competibacteraceae bacterium]|nr:polysaccharide biosynthesis tyrosine autokinase [Candidatus Competibacteraceae bacterium]